jgi:hypothetical protein
LDAWLQL